MYLIEAVGGGLSFAFFLSLSSSFSSPFGCGAMAAAAAMAVATAAAFYKRSAISKLVQRGVCRNQVTGGSAGSQISSGHWFLYMCLPRVLRRVQSTLG